MNPLSEQLINSACSINIKDATDAVSKIKKLPKEEQKEVLLPKNDRGFNAFHALCASYQIKDEKDQNNAKLILSIMKRRLKMCSLQRNLSNFIQIKTLMVTHLCTLR